MECSIERNVSRCNCTYPGCPRHGKCCDCIEYHRKMGELPGCYFTDKAEADWDRSVEHFLRTSYRG
ncbi:MAG: DUF6485 family protein [Thermoplasmatota archaeon]